MHLPLLSWGSQMITYHSFYPFASSRSDILYSMCKKKFHPHEPFLLCTSPRPFYCNFLLPLTTKLFLERLAWHSVLDPYLVSPYGHLAPPRHPHSSQCPSGPTPFFPLVTGDFPHTRSAPRAGESNTSFVSQIHHLFSLPSFGPSLFLS